MHISIFPTLRESHPKIVLNILAVGWNQRTHLIFFLFFFISFCFQFRHLILNISRLSFDGEEKKKNMCKKQTNKRYKRSADIRCHKEFCTWEGREKRGRKRNAEVEHVNTKKASQNSRLVEVNLIRLTTLTFTYITHAPCFHFNKAF